MFYKLQLKQKAYFFKFKELIDLGSEVSPNIGYLVLDFLDESKKPILEDITFSYSPQCQVSYSTLPRTNHYPCHCSLSDSETDFWKFLDDNLEFTSLETKDAERLIENIFFEHWLKSFEDDFTLEIEDVEVEGSEEIKKEISKLKTLGELVDYSIKSNPDKDFKEYFDVTELKEDTMILLWFPVLGMTKVGFIESDRI